MKILNKTACGSRNDEATQIALGLSLQNHARKCNKRLDECHVCQGNSKIYADIPANVIGKVLQDRMPGAAHLSLAELAVTALMTRTLHKTKRASADFAAAFPILKDYETRGGRL